MSISAAQASAFFEEIGPDGAIWTIEDDGGVPAPVGTDGRRAMPFWSKRSRVERITSSVSAYRGFRLREIPRNEFETRWLPGLRRDGLLVGLNWAGAHATGFDLTADEVLARIAA
ncbi:DUF2750 domain-containing protein [Kitasatospora herbaricolor]|uniref:DUF2750 domain-containing protein n=1 Tax=Kitasatospora herbaricolor TaxID=68217 RepID=UPI0036DEC115